MVVSIGERGMGDEPVVQVFDELGCKATYWPLNDFVIVQTWPEPESGFGIFMQGEVNRRGRTVFGYALWHQELNVQRLHTGYDGQACDKAQHREREGYWICP